MLILLEEATKIFVWNFNIFVYSGKVTRILLWKYNIHDTKNCDVGDVSYLINQICYAF